MPTPFHRPTTTPERDPFAWTLRGSNDGHEFHHDRHANESGFRQPLRNAAVQFDEQHARTIFTNSIFKRLWVPEPRIRPHPNSIQLSEIELFDFPAPLTLRVNAATGAMQIANTDPADGIPFDAYRIRSTAGSLNVMQLVGWQGNSLPCAPNCGQSLHDQPVAGFPVGNGTGNGWEEGPGSSNKELSEWFLGSARSRPGKLHASCGAIDHMNMFSVPVVPRTCSLNIAARARILPGTVQYIGAPAGVTGDYNGNGTVDAADYVLWRNGGPLQNDPTAGVQPDDYNVGEPTLANRAGAGAALGKHRPCPNQPVGCWRCLFRVC